MASLLLDAVSGDIDWFSYRDERAEEMRQLIEAKVAGQPIDADEPAPALLPLLDALKQSVATAQANGTTPRVRTTPAQNNPAELKRRARAGASPQGRSKVRLKRRP